jgi:hypothetical protein
MVQPLTKRETKSGNLYTRRPAIEAAIDGLLGLDRTTLERRAAIRNSESTEYIPSECLVHLIRKKHREANAPGRDQLVMVLLNRCDANLNRNVRDDQVPNAAQVRDETLGRFGELFAEDGTGDNPDALDYFEVRFNSAFAALRTDVIREEIRSARRFVPLPTEDSEGESISEDEAISRLPESILRNPASQEDRVFLKELLAAINALPPDVRKAVILCEFWGYDVESDDPNKITAARLCNVSGRTIRKRLSRAEPTLKRFKEEL